MQYTSIAAVAITIIGLTTSHIRSNEPVRPDGTIVLFNGHDLTNFYTFLKGFGKNHDPKNVFTVQDGVLRISGEVDGGLVTEKEYENYRLIVEYKWGAKTWPPREKWAMDSGVFLHCTGPDDAAGDAWPEAFEFQVWQGAVGDFILIPGNGRRSITVAGEQRGRYFYYKPGASKQERVAEGRLNMVAWLNRDPNWRNTTGFRGKDDVEKPHGEWNTIEAICDGDTITHIVNGVVVNKGTNASHTKGRILLQSEGAEIFFRRVELQALEE